MGDGHLFSTTEKIKLIELVSDITEKKIPILVGIHSNQIGDLINEIETLAKKFEYLNFMISPPTLEKEPVDVIKSYFENILGSLTSKNQIYLINNPPQFAGNEIEPNLLKDLMDFSNLKGMIDSFYNIKNCKAYLEHLSSEFTVICGIEQNCQPFLQLIPLNLRKYSGILSSLSNIVNINSKLYNSALDDNIIGLLKFQEQINDIRNKIYEVKTDELKVKIGLKYAFLHLYKDLILRSNTDINFIFDEKQTQIGPISREKIEATINYLLHQKQIYQLFFLGKKDLYQYDEVINAFSNIDVLVEQGKVKKIKGPYIADANTLYRVNFENSQLVFRFRTSQLFQIENIIKEKLLYPFLDKTLKPIDNNLRHKVKEIINTKRGKYIFKKDNPPIIPVNNLVHYDETKETVPYLFSIQEYIPGKPLFQLINQHINEGKNLNTKKFSNLFSNLGTQLGYLHKIKFDSYFNNINDIGKKNKITYSEYLETGLEERLRQASKNNLDFSEEIRDFYRTNQSLIEDETDFVLLHNDFKSQNIIVKDDLGEIKINGIVDFDNWCVGSRAQDFIKIDYWILKPLNNLALSSSFYNAYSKFYTINKDFKKKVELYKLLWLLDEYNLESELIIKSDQKDLMSMQSSSLQNYLFEIKSIIR